MFFMTEKFTASIDGKELFKKSIIFLITYIICIAGLFQMAFREIWPGYFVMFILLFIASFALQYQLILGMIPAVSLGDKSFDFTGTFGDYMKMNLKGLLLSMVTFGIYSCWYSRNYNSFIADHTIYPEKSIAFKGTGGKLFKYMFLGFFLPLIALIIILIPVAMAGPDSSAGAPVLFMLIYMSGLFIISSVITVLQYKWMVDYTFGDEYVRLSGEVGVNAVFYVLGQMLLGLITMGIYFFAAEVKLFAYFADRTVLNNPLENKKRKVHFTGRTGQGFGLILGQTLLTMITLGLYLPVAYANVNNWFISHVEIVEEIIP